MQTLNAKEARELMKSSNKDAKNWPYYDAAFSEIMLDIRTAALEGEDHCCSRISNYHRPFESYDVREITKLLIKNLEDLGFNATFGCRNYLDIDWRVSKLKKLKRFLRIER